MINCPHDFFFLFYLPTVPPTITSPYHSVVTVNKPNTVKLFCNATGNPQPEITWTNIDETVGTGNPYIIPNIMRSDNGQRYICKASNGIGQDKNASMCLNVQCKYNLFTISSNFQTYCLVMRNVTTKKT
jgi:hypothetical protein